MILNWEIPFDEEKVEYFSCGCVTDDGDLTIICNNPKKCVRTPQKTIELYVEAMPA